MPIMCHHCCVQYGVGGGGGGDGGGGGNGGICYLEMNNKQW